MTGRHREQGTGCYNDRRQCGVLCDINSAQESEKLPGSSHKFHWIDQLNLARQEIAQVNRCKILAI
jgi:hypothetical protein